jgi:hypothetical protein
MSRQLAEGETWLRAVIPMETRRRLGEAARAAGRNLDEEVSVALAAHLGNVANATVKDQASSPPQV